MPWRSTSCCTGCAKRRSGATSSARSNCGCERHHMSIQTDADRRGLQAAGRVVHQTLEALAAAVRPDITTAELDAVAARIFDAHGARSAPALVYGFPGTVLISVNDEVVHGVPGPRRIARGDVVKLDVTVERNGYMADAARTVIVGE